MGSPKQDASKQALLDQARQYTQQALAQYNGMTLPELAAQELSLKSPELVGLLNPEKYGKSATEDIKSNPEMRQAQLDALQSLQDVGKNGETAQGKLQLAKIKRDAQSESQAQQASILQDMAARGLANSGTALAARLNAGQSTANRESEAGLQIAAQQEQARLAALQNAGVLAGNIDATDYQRALNVAQAKDAISQMNTALSNQAQQQNLGLKQQYSDAAINIANQQQQYNKQLLQNQYQNQMQLANAKAGVLTGAANQLQQQAAMRQSEPGTNWGGIIGTAAGAGIGAMVAPTGSGAMGALVGSGIGSQVGTAAQGQSGRRYGMYADGGVVRQDAYYPGRPNIGDRFKEEELGMVGVPGEEPQIKQGYDVPEKNKLDDFDPLKNTIAEYLLLKRIENEKSRYADGGIGDSAAAYMLGQEDAKPKELSANDLALLKMGMNNISNSLVPQEQQKPKYMPQPISFAPLKYAEGGLPGRVDENMIKNEMHRADRSALMQPLKDEFFNKPAPQIVAAPKENIKLPVVKSAKPKKFEEGGVSKGNSYVGDRVDAKINDGEMVLNLAQQQKLFDLLSGKSDKKPTEDIVRPADTDETNLHEKNVELDARLTALEKLLARK